MIKQISVAMLTKINGSRNFNKTLQTIPLYLVKCTKILRCKLFIYMSVLLTSLTENMDPYIQSLHKRIKWQIKHEASYCVFNSDFFYNHTKFYCKNESFSKSPKSNFHVIWILTTYSNKVESLHHWVSPFHTIFKQVTAGK